MAALLFKGLKRIVVPVFVNASGDKRHMLYGYHIIKAAEDGRRGTIYIFMSMIKRSIMLRQQRRLGEIYSLALQ